MAMIVAQGFYCLLVREQVEVGLRKDDFHPLKSKRLVGNSPFPS